MSLARQAALFLESKFGNLVVGTTDIPRPAFGEVLVEIKSTALNPVDWKIQKWGFGFENFPAILGFDASGDVKEVGDGVNGFVKGDRVIFGGDWSNRGDTYQQYAVAPVNRTAKIPSNISYDEAATIPLGLTTAWSGLYHKDNQTGFGFIGPDNPAGNGKYTGLPIVILGGASSVGQYAIQLAKYSGFSPIITTASSKHTESLKSLGATHLIDRHVPISELPSAVSKITQDPIQYVYDAISSADTQPAGYNLLAEGGKILLVLDSKISQVEGDKKSVLNVSTVARDPKNADLFKGIYSVVTKLLQTGVIKPAKFKVIPGGLNGIADGLKQLENDQVSGAKLIVHPHETAAASNPARTEL